MLFSLIIHCYPATHHFIQQSGNFSVHDASTWYCAVYVRIAAVCSAPQLSVTAVSEIDTAPDEVVHSITPSVVEQVWSLVQSAPTRPWWTALLPKGQSEEAILRQRYVRTYVPTHTNTYMHTVHTIGLIAYGTHKLFLTCCMHSVLLCCILIVYRAQCRHTRYACKVQYISIYVCMYLYVGGCTGRVCDCL